MAEAAEGSADAAEAALDEIGEDADPFTLLGVVIEAFEAAPDVTGELAALSSWAEANCGFSLRTEEVPALPPVPSVSVPPVPSVSLPPVPTPPP